MLQNDTLVAKIGFDTDENEPAKVSRKWGVQNGSAGGHVCWFACSLNSNAENEDLVAEIGVDTVENELVEVVQSDRAFPAVF